MKPTPLPKPRRLCNLPDGVDINIQHYLLKLPPKALKAFRAYAGGESAMYAVGYAGGYGFMMSPQPPGSSSRRLYPMPDSIAQTDLLDWEIVEDAQ